MVGMPAQARHSVGPHTSLWGPPGGQAPSPGPVRVLMVVYKPMVARLAKLALEHCRYDTRATTSGAEAVTALASWQPHLVLLDMDIDGPAIMDQIGARNTGGGRLPVLALTRRGDLRTKLAALEVGADDILDMPFAVDELAARVIALLRRSYGDAVAPFTPTVINVGELEFDILNRSVRVGVLQLHLTSLEQNLLYLLAANADRAVSREEILDTLWGADYVADSQVVDRHIQHLRARLQDDWRRPRFIATVRGRGYLFVATSMLATNEPQPSVRHSPRNGPPTPPASLTTPRMGQVSAGAASTVSAGSAGADTSVVC
jgi:DNA-binding response OmpR family regulator